METTTSNSISYIQQQLQSFEPSDELIGFEKATLLLAFGIISILIVLIFGIILCRLDISAGKKHRSRGAIYIEH